MKVFKTNNTVYKLFSFEFSNLKLIVEVVNIIIPVWDIAVLKVENILKNTLGLNLTLSSKLK